MFKFFQNKEKSLTITEDRIWGEKASRYQGMFRAAQQLANREYVVVLISFFPETQRELEYVLKHAALALQTPKALSEIILSPAMVLSISAQSILKEGGLATLPRLSYRFLVAEHYPTPLKEQQLHEAIQQIPSTDVQLTYFESLDSPLFQRFSGERIHALLEKMGLKEGEELSNKFINQAIRSAQKKISKEISVEKQANSVETWFQVNILH